MSSMPRKKINYIFSMLLVLLVFTACDKETISEPEVDPCNPHGFPGELISTAYISSFTPEQIQTYLGLFGAPIGLEVEYTIDAFRVSYRSLDKDDELTPASGVMFIPRGLDTLDLLSIQHGTTFKRNEVGSANPLYALDGMITAMNGYMVIVPDYLGLGDSQLLHPYLHAALSANAVMDMIRASKAYVCQNDIILSNRLFLAGYSEGGYVTLAAQKIMETEYSDEFQITAVAPMAGPYDLVGSTRELLSRQNYENPAYLVYLVAAYDDIYGWNRLNDIFSEPYASKIPELLNGNLDGSMINDSLTTNLNVLFASGFKTSFLAGEEEEIEKAFRENSPLDWGPVAPVRLIHGTEDSTVFYSNAVTAYESLKANGGLSVDLVPLYGMDHGTGAFLAYYFAMEWFDSLRTISN